MKNYSTKKHRQLLQKYSDIRRNYSDVYYKKRDLLETKENDLHNKYYEDKISFDEFKKSLKKNQALEYKLLLQAAQIRKKLMVVDAALTPYNLHRQKKVEQFFTRYYNSMGPRTRNHTGYNYWNSNEYNITYVMKDNWSKYLSRRKK
jgi:hypothetical protein